MTDMPRGTQIIRFELECTSGEECALYDEETVSPWWDHNGGPFENMDAIARDVVDNIRQHRSVCPGVVSVDIAEWDQPKMKDN